MTRLRLAVVVLGLVMGGCALDPFGDPNRPTKKTPAHERAAGQLRDDAVAAARRSNEILSAPPTGASRLGAWTGYGTYLDRRVRFTESFWASSWPPAIIAADFRQRFPDLAWNDQPGPDPGEIVIVGHHRDNFVVAAYAHPTRTRYLTGPDASSRVTAREPAPPGTQSYVTVVVIHAGAVASPTAPVVSVPAATAR